ncbi:MAG: protein kinase [Acidobacteriota bacterium]
MKRSGWVHLLVAVALVKVAATFVAYLSVPGALVPIGTGWLADYRGVLSAGAFALGALVFLIGGRNDRRAFDLGVLYLLLASTFDNAPLRIWAEAGARLPGWGVLPKLLEELEVDAFLPLFLWRFALRFPHGHLDWYERRLGSAAVRLTTWGGVILFAVNLFGAFQQIAGMPLSRWGAMLDREDGSLFWGFVFTALVPGLGMIAWRLRGETGEDRRRVRLLLGALLLGFAPMVVANFGEFVLGAVVPPIGAAFAAHRALLIALCFSFLWSVPFTSAYAVLVHQVLDLRLIARGIVSYAMARATVVALGAIPFGLMVWYLFEQRARPIGEVFSEGKVLRLGFPAAVGLAMLWFRRPILAALDRHFFREQVDARQILTELVQRIRTAASPEDLANLILGGIDRALHLEHSALLLEDHRTGQLEDPRRRARRLDASSPLGLKIAEASEPLDVDLENPRSPLALLPEADRHWLADAELRLLVPIQAASGSLLGVIALGTKKSELPFLREDRRLLADVARTAALGLELQSSREREAARPIEESAPHDDPSRAEPERFGPAAEAARECLSCGGLYRAFLVYCGKCSHRLESAPIPYILPGRYRFEQRLGIGGMGVVYRGTDLALGRPIAAKTLRRVSPEDAVRLRREARTAARFSHTHLAGVYGIETWLGTPIMIFEYLAGGTLADRLTEGQLSPLETIDLGIAMAGALERLHEADILHRDVKPSNIGYSGEGVPKLMDFGIARAPGSTERESPRNSELPQEDIDSTLLPPTWIGGRPGSSTGTSRERAAAANASTASTASHVMAGTLPYLAPEILNGGAPDVACDLWSLSVVLFECLLGRKVFSGDNDRQLSVRIQLVRVPDLAAERPDTPKALVELFRGTLHRARTRRPDSAHELARRLAEVRAQL